ncbi:hypothetical protein [Nocardia sp. NRRL S-836]|uniref:hypothetical protein n=1 Tax=Nocardia sp. NRRL S-836 TaxID=1519492 RepID=UPI0006AEAB64|nr:hypothetical protein [Nocardia sp. NRRL S-836]KOV81822.1 hypothetical protein ADL03_27025 [Nocardia sp. NRRL S-836]
MITRRIVTRLLATATVVSAMTLTVPSGTSSAQLCPRTDAAGSPTPGAAGVDAHAATAVGSTGFGAVDVTVRTRAGTDQPPGPPAPAWISGLRTAGRQVAHVVRLRRG